MRRLLGAAGLVGAVVALLGSTSASSYLAATAARKPHRIASKQNGIRLRSKIVSISRATIAHNLIGISADGTFKFKRAAGALAKLRAGKVMLIRGSDAVVVKGVARGRGKLLVHTKPAKLTDVISSGKITFAGAPDFRKAMLIRNATASSKHAQTDFAPLAYRHLGGPRASTASFPSLSSQGSVGPIGYSLTFRPSSSTRLDLSGTLCFASGSICANGPSNGLDAEVNLSGYLDFGSASGGIAVNGGRVTHSSLAISALNAHLKLTYHITRGEGTESNPPIVSIPVGVGISVPGPGAIPIYIRLQFLAAMSFGLVKGSVVNGGVEWSSTGSDTLIQSGNSLSASTTGGIENANILNQSNGGVPPSFAATASGTTITVREKLGIWPRHDRGERHRIR